MKYLLSQMVWKEKDPGFGNFMWQAPHPADRVLDLRPLAAQATPEQAQGFVMIATERDPRPGETLIAGAVNETLKPAAVDAIKDLLAIPETLSASTLPELTNRLVGVFSDPDAGILCPPLMPGASGQIRLSFGDLFLVYPCPKSGTHRKNIEKVLHATYRNAKQNGDGKSHRKLLSVWRRKFGVRNYETFIPADLPKEKPLIPRTTLQDNFDVGNHANIDGEASSDGWLWNKFFNNGALVVIRTDTQVYAEGQSINQSAYYRADSDLSSTDHYVQCMMRTENNAFTPMVIARQDGTVDTEYTCQLAAGGDNLSILKVVTGTPTLLQQNAMTINTATWYTIKFDIDGSTIRTYDSGVQVGADLTDTAIPGGLRCGIGAQGNSGVLQTGGYEDFEASDGIAAIADNVYSGRTSRRNLTRRVA